ncbi:glucose-6-phosphate isomerase [Philodulcilactobacillus myokoensis]|uniref:Glucose-6-phosphate isomerase n=1 Tax=Philodulcilactobacillus myokoensis TaxID=2929573 RepID=A0A9W6ESN0_9LACO|nr:glucose-6-phosphate isomerase [Philodulcilactobacillus myokoensis]GLB46314.1 glucose-6-phosphate isomerase [Philodulcilactobacillus myokoensis]
MAYLKLDSSKLNRFVNSNEVPEMQALVNAANRELRDGTGAGNNYREWLHLPTNYDHQEFERIKKDAQQIQSDSDFLIVIGIGGSYLGAKMAVDFLHGDFDDLNSSNHQTRVIFAGNSLSSSYLHDLLELIDGHDFSINMVSKSGTTTEPSVAFRIFRKRLIKQYGAKEAVNRIYVTTDAKNGALRQEVNEKGYESFIIPNGIGGRYSVLTPVGLLPIAVSGGDIDQLMLGAHKAEDELDNPDLTQNNAYRYAALRNILYRKGYGVELLENYEPNMRMFAEWWKQLTGESEGKDHKGIFPASANLTTDLHSLGQYIQQGRRILMETVVKVNHPRHDVDIPHNDKNTDELQYLEGHTVDYVNTRAYEGVVKAHTDGGVPVMTVNIPDESAYTLGYLIYFFEVAIAISGYLNGVNPFNQPGVEEYKTNMFILLNKPGYTNK